MTVEPIFRCDECLPCRQGRYNVCVNVGQVGLSADGGMAEYVAVEARMAHLLPDEVSDELGALVEPMAVGYHAAKLGEPDPHRTALVFGAGPIGIGLWFALRGLGIEDILVVEPSPTRRQSIERLGACTLDPSRIDVAAFVADRTNGAGAGAVYEAAGVEASIEAGLACLGPTKTMVCVAVYEQPVETRLLQLVLKEARIQGILCYTGDDYRAVIDLMARGHYDTTGWVDKIGIDDVVKEGFEALRAGHKMKVLVDPTRASHGAHP